MTEPHYSDDLVTLFHGKCEEILDWTTADVLITDPPYGRDWKQGELKGPLNHSDAHRGIDGDKDTGLRDWILATWGTERLAVCFGDLMLPPPVGVKHVLIYQKPSNAGTRGAIGGYRRDAEAIYLLGPWPSGLGGRTSIIRTGARSQGNPSSVQARYQHPHAKPVDVIETIILGMGLPKGSVIADPTAGGGSILVAARNLGYRAIGVEKVAYDATNAARRLAQRCFHFDEEEVV